MPDPVRGRRRRYILVLMALTALTLATLSQREGDSGPIGAAGGAAHRIVQPVTDAADSVFSPLHDWWHGFWHHGDVVAQNRKLRQELEAALANNDAQSNAVAENKRYNEFFNETYWSDYKQAGATVVDDSPGNNETTVTINRGREAGIRDGMAVVAQRGLVGVVVETWNGGSKVMLVTDPSFGVGARTLVDDHYANAQTDPDGVLRMLFAGNGQPKAIKPLIKVGQAIVTCGCANSRLPRGIPIGTVSDVSNSFDGSAVRVAVMPTLDRPSLDQVKVILWTPGMHTPTKVTDFIANAQPKPSTTTTTTSGTTTTTVGH